MSIFKAFSSKKEDKPIESLSKKQPKEEVKVMAIITLEDYFTSSGRYKDRAKSKERTEDIESNAEELLERVNALLSHLGIKKADISSGFRTSESNASVSNAAKKSLHQVGSAIDIVDDKDQKLYKLISSQPELLKKFNLWLEHGDSTRGKNTNWVHLDSGTRKEREIRIFKP
mgnify:FL=1